MDEKTASPFEQFEEQMKLYFPEIHQMLILAKDKDKGGGGEVHFWTLMQELVRINQMTETGIVFINFSKGRIDNISYKRDLLAYKGRPGY